MFIEPDDHVLLMISQEGGQFSTDDLKRVHDAGVKTVVRYVIWRDIEPEPFRWSGLKTVERWLYQDREAGLKTLLGVYDLAPAHFPDNWYIQDESGNRFTGSFYENLLAPWVENAWDTHLRFIETICHAVTAFDVLPFRATMHGGEVMFPDLAPVKLPSDQNLQVLCERIFVEEQAIFYAAHDSHELFTSFHHAFDPLPYTGNLYAYHLYNLLDDWPDVKHYGICYTRFEPVGGVEAHDQDTQSFPLFCGSEYCEGLIHNTETAIRLGYRGFVTAPLHGLTDHRVLEPWMVQAIQDSVRKWEQASVRRT